MKKPTPNQTQLPTPTPVQALVQVPIAQIVAGALQSRTVFDEKKLNELAESIKEKSIIEPLILRRVAKMFSVEPGKRSGKPGFFLVDWRRYGVADGSEGATGWRNTDGAINPELNARAGAVMTFFSTKDEAEAATPHFEIVAGERRFRAAKIAGLTEVPAIIRDLSDDDAFDIALIENLQREDLDIFEQAAAYQKALANKRYPDVDALAKRLGKSRSAVYSVLKLNNVPEDVRPRILSGEISPSVGELIARMPNETLRAKFAAEILKGKEYWGRDPDSPGDDSPLGYKKRVESLSLREVKELQSSKYMVQLKGSIFDRNDAELVPAAGACSACPKMTGNARELYPNGRADICTDPVCFAAKTAAHSKAVVERGTAAGLEIIKGGKSLFDSYQNELGYGSDYLDVAKQVAQDPKKNKRSLKQLLEGSEVKIYGAVDHKGTLRRLVKRDDAVRVLKDKHKIALPPKMGSGHTYDPKKEAAERAKREFESKLRESVKKKVLDGIGAYKWKVNPVTMRIVVESFAEEFASSDPKTFQADLKKAKTADDLFALLVRDFVAYQGFDCWAGQYGDKGALLKRLLASGSSALRVLDLDVLLSEARSEAQKVESAKTSNAKKVAKKKKAVKK